MNRASLVRSAVYFQMTRHSNLQRRTRNSPLQPISNQRPFSPSRPLDPLCNLLSAPTYAEAMHGRTRQLALSIISTVGSAEPQPKRNGLLCWLGGRGAVARVPSLLASRAPLLTPLCASRAAFLRPLRRSCRRSVPDFAVSVAATRGGGSSGGLGFSRRDRQHRRRSDKSKCSRVSKESECAATTDLFRLRTFTHFQALLLRFQTSWLGADVAF
ncbi:hypothetical protein ACVIF9_002799 [Bradyrhizobium sp. USDA 4350]